MASSIPKPWLLASVASVLALTACSAPSPTSSAINSSTTSSARQSTVFGIADGKNVLMPVSLTDLTSDTRPFGKYVKVYNDLPDDLSPEEQMRQYGRYDEMKDCEFPSDDAAWTLEESDPCFDSLQAYYTATQVSKAYEALGYSFPPVKVMVNFKKDGGKDFIDNARHNAGTNELHFGLSKSFQPLIHFNEILFHEFTHYVEDQKPNSKELKISQSLFEGLSDLMAYLFTGIRELGKGTNIDKPEEFRSITNNEIFARNNDTDGYGNTNPMISSIVELLDKVNALSSADNRDAFARIALSTYFELTQDDGFGEFFARFKTNMQKVLPNHAEYDAELEQILARKGLVNGRYTNGILLNGDFFEKKNRNHLNAPGINQKTTVTFTVQDGVAQDPTVSFPLTMYILNIGMAEFDTVQKCEQARTPEMSNSACIDSVLKDEPSEQNDLWLSTRRMTIASPGDISFQAALQTYMMPSAIQFLFVDSKGAAVATQAHKWNSPQLNPGS